jgi:hypothetical protein
LPKGSIWRDKISLAILEMQEKGEIQMLYDKWWKKTEETCVRDENQKETTKANSLVCINKHLTRRNHTHTQRINLLSIFMDDNPCSRIFKIFAV